VISGSILLIPLLITRDITSFRFVWWATKYPLPIGSMYAIYGNIYHQYTPNVSIYSIHGSYGLQCLHLINWCKLISTVRDSHLAQASAACPPAGPLSASPGVARGATQATRTWGTSCFPSEHRPGTPPRTTGGRSPWQPGHDIGGSVVLWGTPIRAMTMTL